MKCMMLSMTLLVPAATAVHHEMPHGMLVHLDDSHPSKAVHQAVLREKSQSVCEARLEHLRALIASDEIETALELALALKNRDDLPSACRADTLFTGIGAVYNTVSTMHESENATALRSSTIRFKDDRVLPCKSLMKIHPAQAAVAGFELDGEFILAETPILCDVVGSSLLCEAAGTNLNLTMTQALVYASKLRGQNSRLARTHKLHQRSVDETEVLRPSDEKEAEIEAAAAADGFIEDIGLGFAIDESSSYLKGTKKILYIPVCAADYGEGCGQGFNYGLTASKHGGDVTKYLQKVHEVTNDYFKSNSFGRFELEERILDPIQLDFSASSCGSASPLTYWGKYKSSALDYKTYHKVEELYGINVIKDYDFHIIVSRFCSGYGWSGIGWIGVPGAAINLYGYNYDASVVHELGHNFGADHASTMSGGAKGAKAYKDSSSTWSEYGSVHSTMGKGNHESNGAYQPGKAEFMASSKIVFDWLDGDNEIATVVPYKYSNGEALCTPCSPITLQTTDAGSLEVSDAVVAIEIECEKSNRYFFLEYREVTPNSPGVLASWATVSYSAGRTGVADNNVLADANPATSTFNDGMIVPGSDFTVYCGKSGTQYPVNIAVASSGKPGAVEVTLNSDDIANVRIIEPTPRPTPKPTPRPTPRPTPKPTPKATQVGDCIGTCFGKASSTSTAGDAVYVDPSTGIKAGIRCCNDDGRGDSICPDGRESRYEFQRAYDECSAVGMRLCSVEEIMDDFSNVAGTGCGYDNIVVWTSDVGTCAPETTTRPTPGIGECAATFDGKPSAGATLEDAIFMDPREAISMSSLRCCNDFGKGDSLCPNGVKKFSYQTAIEECSAVGMRLCSCQEILDNFSEIYGTGCNYDHMNVWASDIGSCAEPPIVPGECAAILDGRPPSSYSVSDATYVDPTDASVAGIRCCVDDDDRRGRSLCPDGSGTTYDFLTAYAECEKRSMRLCTTQEIIDDHSNIWGTGCNYDHMNVWTADSRAC